MANTIPLVIGGMTRASSKTARITQTIRKTIRAGFPFIYDTSYRRPAKRTDIASTSNLSFVQAVERGHIFRAEGKVKDRGVLQYPFASQVPNPRTGILTPLFRSTCVRIVRGIFPSTGILYLRLSVENTP